MPVPLPPSGYDFDIPPGAGDLVGTGADLEPATLLDGYRSGLFPMGLGESGAAPIGWWSPDPRGVLFPADLAVSRSLRRSVRRFEITVDTAADDEALCYFTSGTTGQPKMCMHAHSYGLAHQTTGRYWLDLKPSDLHWLYGVAIGGLFAGESMFHTATDASKVALVALVEILAEDDDPRRLIDVQWSTSHLSTLGVEEVPRPGYLALLSEALAAPLPRLWRSAGSSA